MNRPERWRWLRLLRVRLVLWTVMLEAILLVVFAFLLVVILQNNQSQRIDETLRLSAAQMNAVVDVRGSTFTIPAQDVTEIQSLRVMVWLLTRDQSLGATVGQAGGLPVPSPLPDMDVTRDVELKPGEWVRLLVTPLREGTQLFGTLVLGLPLQTEFEVIQQVQLSLLVSIPVVLLLSAVGGLFLANRALSPVKNISETARQISATDLSKRIMLAVANDEIGQLARTFNAMLDRIDNAFRRERQFTSDVSHELRTPLGFLKTQLSLARSKPRSASDLLAMLAEMETDVDRMTRLIEQMLTLARTENQDLPEKHVVRLEDVLHALAQQYHQQAESQHVQFVLDIPADVSFEINGAPPLIHQVFVNLLDNALRYTPPQGTIQLRLRKHWQQIEVVVADNGQGIAPEHLPHIFERFYRVDSARTRASGGSGLGLAITRAIVRAHGGEIQIVSEPGVGTTFTIYFPALHTQ